MYVRSSPRTWGCFSSLAMLNSQKIVFPTHVGVFPKEERDQWRERRLPHARGGVSDGGKKILTHAESSPRTWGCFCPRQSIPRPFEVFPTHVGVFLAPPVHSKAFRGLPHARGGVSTTMIALTVMLVSSPRTWGCFFRAVPCAKPHYSLPHARGVFLRRPRPLSGYRSLPHARGGVSSFHSLHFFSGWSSPRTWGCFTLGAGLSGFGIVFPTHVGGRQAEVAPRKPLPHGWGFSRLPLT